MTENPDDPVEQIPIDDLKVQPEAEDLVNSAAMKPYVKLAVAIMAGRDSRQATSEISTLPLEQRYVWRVASALKWAFVDMETMNVKADRETLSPEDHQRLLELLNHRPLQFCLFLSALLGQQEMEAVMITAVKQSRLVTEHSE